MDRSSNHPPSPQLADFGLARIVKPEKRKYVTGLEGGARLVVLEAY